MRGLGHNRVAVVILGLGAVLAAATALGQSQPTELTAIHRSGQTFLTFHERTELSGEHYRVYRHGVAIGAGNLAQATRIAELWRGSARVWGDRVMDDGGTWRARYLERAVIADNGPQLAEGVGLLVWTLHADELGGAASGSGYYAVTTVDASGNENTATFSAGNSIGPVAETVADPMPVELAVASPAGGHVLLQYMDLRRWNPTFHAPGQRNGYLGLNLSDPGVAHALAYAYTYEVGEPQAGPCGGSVPASVPVSLVLHGWGGGVYPPSPGPSQWYCAWEIRPTDYGETWWFGFARDHDFRLGGEPAAGDVVVNYTEQRLLRMVHDLLRHPSWGAHADRERVYVWGQSMGGSGTLALALRYSDVFAAAYASEPMTDYRTCGDGGGADWRGDIEWKWGSRNLNLPVELAAPGGWGSGLSRYNGVGVWDWQSHRTQIASRTGDDAVPFGIAHGRQDIAIEWPTQGRPFYAAANAAARSWGGAVVDADHTWLSFVGLPPNLAVDGSLVPFEGFGVVLHETVPGLANASSDLALPPPDAGPPGGYNQAIQWSASWDAWDGAPVDTTAEWGISLRSSDASTHTADVTPRRLQHFSVTAGSTFSYENVTISDGGTRQVGAVRADASGLVTLPAMQATPGGNRLRLRPGSGGNQPPVAAFTATPSSGTAPLQALLDAGASSDPDGQITAYAWSFGDGSTGTGVAVNHTFITAATRAVTLTVTDNGGATATATHTVTVLPASGRPRPWPDTTRGVHAFSDQLPTTLSDAQVRFAASHFAGTQKMTRADADRLRAVNPAFLILHYRLGLGLGYRAADASCQPTGDWLRVIEGDDWVQEWPTADVPESYLYHWPESSTTRVYNCDWGWYVTALDNPAFRNWWLAEVQRQLVANDDDGVFMDSYSIPSFLGFDHYRPVLPEVDAAFEAAWARRLADYLAWLRPRLGGWVVPNVGMWVTSRETTDYSGADGLMIEQFAMEADASPLALADWQLQMSRALGATGRGQALIAQSYVSGGRERLFCLGSYLLVKGSASYLNLLAENAPEWWPEYNTPIGAPLTGPVGSLAELDPDGDGVYRRDFDNGFVLVNATSPFDGTGVTHTVAVGPGCRLLTFSGGGTVGGDGTTNAAVTSTPVAEVTLPPASAAVLLTENDSRTPRRHFHRGH
jgi:PKD repeat protein